MKLQPWQEAAWDLIANLPPVPDGKVRIWYYNRKGQYVYADVEPQQEQNMSDGKKNQDECCEILTAHGLMPSDLTLEEKRYYNDAWPAKLREALSRREPQHFEYGLTLAEDDIPEDAVEYWVADVDEAAQETIMQAQNIRFFEDLPDNAVLFWENGDLAFYHTLNGSVYVTESQSDEGQSNPIAEWESDYEVEVQTWEEEAAEYVEELRDRLKKSVALSTGPFAEAVAAIWSERAYQQKAWSGERVTESADGPDDRSIDEWTLYILRYANRLAAHNGVNAGVYCEKLETIRKIAALCVAAMEQHGALPREANDNPERTL